MANSPVESSFVLSKADSPVESSFVLDRFDSPVESSGIHVDCVGGGKVLHPWDILTFLASCSSFFTSHFFLGWS